jgi:hypothetical protein
MENYQMNTLFAVVLTVMAQPTNVASNAPVTLQPDTTITFTDTTEKKAMSSCTRVLKALATSGKLAFCADKTETSAQ